MPCLSIDVQLKTRLMMCILEECQINRLDREHHTLVIVNEVVITRTIGHIAFGYNDGTCKLILLSVEVIMEFNVEGM